MMKREFSNEIKQACKRNRIGSVKANKPESLVVKKRVNNSWEQENKISSRQKKVIKSLMGKKSDDELTWEPSSEEIIATSFTIPQVPFCFSLFSFLSSLLSFHLPSSLPHFLPAFFPSVLPSFLFSICIPFPTGALTLNTS